MKIRLFGLLLLFAFLSAGQFRLTGQETAPAPDEKPAAPAAGESAEEAAEDPAESPASARDDDADPAEEPPVEEDAQPEEAPANEPAPDAGVQEAIEEAEPATEPTEGEVEAAQAVETDAETIAADAEMIADDGIEESTPDPVADELGAPLDLDSLPTADGLDVPNPDDLLPEDVYMPDDDIAPPAPTVTENKFEKDRRLAIRYQEVKLQALKDQAIREMREKADVARTDEDKRAALREYYKMLFAKMVSIDVDLEDKCRLMETAYMRRVSQFRVAPTIPLNPPPTPDPLPGRAESTPPGSDSDEG